MQRREAFLTLGAMCLSTVAGRPAHAGGTPGAAEDLRLRMALRDPESARTVARHLPPDAFIGREPEESAELIIAEMGTAPDGPAVAARIRADFGAGRIVLCDGWTLSLTEARLCALWR